MQEDARASPAAATLYFFSRSVSTGSHTEVKQAAALRGLRTVLPTKDAKWLREVEGQPKPAKKAPLNESTWN